MSNEQVFLLPDVGEGLTEAEILQWAVQVGDSVEINQIIVEVETAKAAVELPSPYAGVVGTLHAQDGETLPVGKPLITILSEVSGAPDVTEPGPDREALLVGYGPQEGSGRRRRRRPGATPPTDQPIAPATERTAAKPPSANSPKTSVSTSPSSPPQALRAPSPATMYAGQRRLSPWRRKLRNPRLRGRSRDPHPDSRRTQAHRGCHGRFRVHGTARHRVHDGRRHGDHAPP